MGGAGRAGCWELGACICLPSARALSLRDSRHALFIHGPRREGWTLAGQCHLKQRENSFGLSNSTTGFSRPGCYGIFENPTDSPSV